MGVWSIMEKKHIEQEWGKLLKVEERFLGRNLAVKDSFLQEKAGRFVPDKLQETLDKAFLKAFALIFEKGTGVIEKTYNREKKEQDFKIRAYSAEVRKNRKALRAFGKEAAAGKTINMAVSAVEGVGMGLLGLGLPDIPLFLGVLLKSIYEIALSYGFSYDSEEEHIFILKLVETALSHEDRLMEGNLALNQWISEETPFGIGVEEQMKRTAHALSMELLCLKFIQGLPVVGVLGGISDMVYQKKISDYAALKYQRRFLQGMKEVQ